MSKLRPAGVSEVYQYQSPQFAVRGYTVQLQPRVSTRTRILAPPVNSTVQYSTVEYSTVQYSVAPGTHTCSTVQYSTVQYTTVQYSVASGMHTSVQYSTWVSVLDMAYK